MTTDILRKNDSFYDIESLHDIYTKVVVTPHQRAITLFIHTEPGSDAERFMQEPHAEEQIIKRVKELNHNFINKYHMSIHISNLTNWSIMMRQTLSNNVCNWYRSFCSEAPRTWTELIINFLSKYYSESKAHRMRGIIISFKNNPVEGLYEGYLRYKRYLDNCPHHRLPDWLITHTFYGGLNNENRMNLYTASNGSFLSYTYDEA